MSSHPWLVVALVVALTSSWPHTLNAADGPSPLVIGDTFTVESQGLKETRRVNVYLPSAYTTSPDTRFPVIYLLDGGVTEDFLHIAGLVQVGAGNGTMRPCILVGIENTQRRRDMTAPTENADDKKIAKQVGGSAAFRVFIRDELMPQVKARYRTTKETAVVGESLAGLFVVETFLLEPELFDTYIAIDPSLWWNDKRLVAGAGEQLRKRPKLEKRLYLASSDEKDIAESTAALAAVLKEKAPAGVRWHYSPMPEESHGTIFHPAALKAFRHEFKPPVQKK